MSTSHYIQNRIRVLGTFNRTFSFDPKHMFFVRNKGTEALAGQFRDMWNEASCGNLDGSELEILWANWVEL